MPISGQMQQAPIADLILDAKNPRLPDNIGLSQDDQDELIVYVADEYDALRIARSISEFGYFPTEAPICIEEDGVLIVVEGNRRLAALKILLDDNLRAHPDLPKPSEWDALSGSDLIPNELDVLVVSSRQEVAPLIAYRHISGIEAWEPWAQARFVANLIDEQNVEFTEAASLVGETEATVKRYYRDHGVLEQAEEDFQVDTHRAQARFGVFTRAMQDGGVREYIEAPTPGQTEKGTAPLPADKEQEVRELLGWLFGDEGREKVIDESRDITSLGKVLGSGEAEALRLLRDENDLPRAFAAAGGIKDRLLKYLRDALVACIRALEDLPEHAADSDVREAVDELDQVVTQLDEMVQ